MLCVMEQWSVCNEKNGPGHVALCHSMVVIVKLNGKTV